MQSPRARARGQGREPRGQAGRRPCQCGGALRRLRVGFAERLQEERVLGLPRGEGSLRLLPRGTASLPPCLTASLPASLALRPASSQILTTPRYSRGEGTVLKNAPPPRAPRVFLLCSPSSWRATMRRRARPAPPARNTKGCSSTCLAMGFANVRAGTQKSPAPPAPLRRTRGLPPLSRVLLRPRVLETRAFFSRLAGRAGTATWA